MEYNFKKIILGNIIVGLWLVATALPASAAAFSAQKIIASSPNNKLDQLEVYTYTIGFKNTGTETWTQSGNNAVTVKTTDKVVNEHWFASPTWLDKITVTKSAAATVKPGEVGFFTVILQAPKKARAFDNHFALFSGSKKISGTDFLMPITVSNKVATKVKQAIPNLPKLASTTTTTYKTSTVAKAQLLIKSDASLSLMGGESANLMVGFKNIGERNWRNATPSLVTLEIDSASTNGQDFKDGWASATTVDVLDQALVENGQIGYFTYKIKAPKVAGTYNLIFKSVLNGDSLIPGGQITVPVVVTVPPPPAPIVIAQNPVSTIVCAAAVDDTVITNDLTASEGQQVVGAETGTCSPPHKEPLLRVGLASVQGQLGLTASQPFQVWQNGQAAMNVEANVTIFLSYDSISKQYTAVGPGPILNSPTPFVVKNTVEPSIITLVTYNLPVAYNPGWNDNSYRGSISIQWSENDGKLWIINEVPMEQYLRGLAEASNGAPMEFQKAQVIAARTYALYHYQTNSKHIKRNFHLLATVSDQYYRGYNSELRIPNIGLAAEQTRGQVVTYQGQVVITPYSASTNGTTRLWSEVWGGSDKPWLIKKAVPEDVGRTRFGHGVGLSQLAAQAQAKAGKNYVDILKFFYVNTEVTQWY